MLAVAEKPETTPLPFGAAVAFTQTYRRQAKQVRHRLEKTWVTNTFAIPQRGLLIGYRTLANGAAVYEGAEEGTIFYPSDYVRAALVATDLKRKPVLVPLTHLIQIA